MVSSCDINEFTNGDNLIINHSDFLNIFFQKIKYFAIVVCNTYFFLTFGKAIISSFSKEESYYNHALTPNLPFCETPFAMTPYMAQGASAMAHLPYVPILLLGIYYACPEIIPSFKSENSHKIKNLLWTQTVLQLFTSLGGHMLPNPRAVLNQEISITIAFAFLYLFFDFTTSHKNMCAIDIRSFVCVVMISIIGYIKFGLMPIIFTLFTSAVSLSFVIKFAFGLLTPYSRTILLSIFIPTSVVLVIETIACEWLLKNVSYLLPWHLLFDILFWQVLGSAIDVIIVSPIPGRFMLEEEEKDD